MLKALPVCGAGIDLTGAIARLGETVYEWQSRFEQRCSLLELDDRLREDMGLTHADIYAEVRKPFWRD